MKVEAKCGKASIIEVGDVFYSKSSDCYLMLIINLEKRYYLHGLDGEHLVGNFYETLDRAKKDLYDKVDEGYYIHYPKSQYKLVMREV